MKKTLDEIKSIINNSEHILIGAGAGLSTAAGIDYAGEKFKEDFKPFMNEINHA